MQSNSYNVEVMDAYGCRRFINTTVIRPASLTGSLDIRGVLCFGGMLPPEVKGVISTHTMLISPLFLSLTLGSDGRIIVNVQGGTGLLRYQLKGVVDIPQTSNTFDGDDPAHSWTIPGGNYTVIVYDSMGCNVCSSLSFHP